MDLVLILVVLPLATIIFSIALQRLLKCPILVAAVVFAIFLILTYTVFGTDFIIFAILFAILAFITAFLVSLFCRILRRLSNLEGRDSNCNDDNNCRRPNRCGCNCNGGDDSDNGNLLTITSRCGNGDDTQLLSISSNGNCNNGKNNCSCNNSSNNNCGCNSNNSENIVLSAEVVPNSTGRSGSFRGNFRRCR